MANNERDLSAELLGKSLMNTKPLVITDTTTYTNVDAYAIYAITDTTFTTFQHVGDGDSLASSTLTAGHIWYIPIVGTVKLAGGSAIVYQNHKLAAQ